MANFDKFVSDMAEFRGNVTSQLESICKDLQRIELDRKEHSGKFWDEMNIFKSSINEINTEVKVIKARAGVIATVTAFFISLIVTVVGWFIKK